MIPDEAPPPYAPTDPLLSWNNGSNNGDPNLTTTDELQDPQLPPNFNAVVQSPGDTISTDISKGESTTVPNHFASAAGYFAVRPPNVFSQSQESLVHHLTISPRSQVKDFPRRPRCWNPRGDEITQHDWNTFLNFMFPPHLAPPPPKSRSRKGKAEEERDQKDYLREAEEDRVARLTAIVAEWNEGFFNPRALSISWVYVANGDAPPLSSLCPNCYPAATRAYQNRRYGRSRSMEAPIPPEAEVPVRSNTGWTIPRKPVQPQVNDNTGPVRTELNPAATPFHPFKPYSQFPQNHPWMAGNWSTSSLGHGRGQGPLAWAAALSARAQEYTERFSEQVQSYGKWAEAHGQRIEEFAQIRGRQIEAAGDRFNHFCSKALNPGATWSHSRGWRDGSHYWGGANTGYGPEQAQRSRSLSLSSSSSEESLSSIESFSTASDLDTDDLTTTRVQLSSLETYHDRDLHSAAVELRNHLRVLQHAHREARTRGNHSHGCGRGRAYRGHHWGSKDEDRRKEMHALREEFRAVGRRARREMQELQREKRAAHRSRHWWWHGHRQRRSRQNWDEAAQGAHVGMSNGIHDQVSPRSCLPPSCLPPSCLPPSCLPPSCLQPSCLRTTTTNLATPDSISTNASFTPISNTTTTETLDDTQKARTKEVHKLLKAQRTMAEKRCKQKKEEKRTKCRGTSGSAIPPPESVMSSNTTNSDQQ